MVPIVWLFHSWCAMYFRLNRQCIQSLTQPTALLAACFCKLLRYSLDSIVSESICFRLWCQPMPSQIMVCALFADFMYNHFCLRLCRLIYSHNVFLSNWIKLVAFAWSFPAYLNKTHKTTAFIWVYHLILLYFPFSSDVCGWLFLLKWLFSWHLAQSIESRSVCTCRDWAFNGSCVITDHDHHLLSV